MAHHLDLTPTAVSRRLLRTHVLPFAKAVSVLQGSAGAAEEWKVDELRSKYLAKVVRLPAHDRMTCTSAVNVLADLIKQGWQLEVVGGAINGREPSAEHVGDIRERRRQQLSARRNEQLRETATREFVREMEAGHLHSGKRVSIFNLMRDGHELAERLATQPDGAVLPYLQFASKDKTCDLTGFHLQDIWRYFRHTWSNPYESIPGRTMLLLVRDAATPFHAVMGIAALSSAASILPARDDVHLRWTGDAVVADWQQNPTAKVADWILDFIEALLKATYRSDLIEDELLPARLPLRPTETLIQALNKEADRAKQVHHRQMSGVDYKDEVAVDEDGEEDWASRARRPLFRAKRAQRLATLLQLRSTVLGCYAKHKGAERLRALLADTQGRDAARRLVRLARSESIGSAIADLTVCGAVAPYNELIAGKLIAALAVSPETTAEYRRRYADAASVIASSMAGKRVVRRSDLVFVGTTSLYGVRPSQYDRISVPADVVQGRNGPIHYKYLGDTKGFGTFQFGSATRQSLEALVIAKRNGRRVNNVFGEGANPKLRALREGLESLGLPENLLVHGLKKCVYGVDLISNIRDYLLGIDKKPRYLFKVNKARETTAAIGEWWWQRWAKPRTDRPDWRERVSKHRLIYPITHGARVAVPEIDSGQTHLQLQ